MLQLLDNCHTRLSFLPSNSCNWLLILYPSAHHYLTYYSLLFRIWQRELKKSSWMKSLSWLFDKNHFILCSRILKSCHYVIKKCVIKSVKVPILYIKPVFNLNKNPADGKKWVSGKFLFRDRLNEVQTRDCVHMFGALLTH